MLLDAGEVLVSLDSVFRLDFPNQIEALFDVICTDLATLVTYNKNLLIRRNKQVLYGWIALKVVCSEKTCLLFVELQESYGALVVSHDDFQVCWVPLGESAKRGQF